MSIIPFQEYTGEKALGDIIVSSIKDITCRYCEDLDVWYGFFIFSFFNLVPLFCPLVNRESSLAVQPR